MDRILKKPIVVTMLAVLCMVLWGSAFPAVKTGYRLFGIEHGTVPDKLVFAGMRFFIAGIALLLILLCMPGKRLKVKAKDLKHIVVLGLLQTFIQYLFFYIALSQMQGSKGSILNATGTFFVIILGHFLFKNEKLTKLKSLGCILGFAGIILINLSGKEDLSFRLTAEGFILFAALAFALGSIYSKMILKDLDAVTLTGYQLTFGGVLLLLVGLLQGGRLYQFSLTAGVLFAYLVLISSVGFAVWTLLIKYNDVTQIAIYNCLNPVFGTILSGIFLSESILKWKNLIALLLVVAGIYLVNTVNNKSNAKNTIQE